MNLQSKLAVSVFLIALIVWIFRSFTRGKLGSGQTLFWLSLLVGAELCTLSPQLVDWINLLWPDLAPVSWITFMGLLALIVYLLYQATRFNQLRSRYVDLARSISFIEQRLRDQESRHGPNTDSAS